MAIAGRLEINLGSVIDHPTVAPMVTENLTKGLFQNGRLLLAQPPGWYVPEPVVFEPVVVAGVASSQAVQGDRFYGFSAKVEAHKSPEIRAILSLLPAPVTLRDYCYLGGGGTPLQDTDGHYYVIRTGRLTLFTLQNPGTVTGGRGVYLEEMAIKFEQL